MKLAQGNMMDVFAEADHFIICGSSNLRKPEGHLVMVEGLGAVMAAKFPKLPIIMGKWLADNYGAAGIYDFHCNGKVGLFQNMLLLRYGVDLAMVSRATKKLKEMAEANPGKQFHLESPQAKEPWWLLKDIVASLPDNVTVWQPK